MTSAQTCQLKENFFTRGGAMGVATATKDKLSFNEAIFILH